LHLLHKIINKQRFSGRTSGVCIAKSVTPDARKKISTGSLLKRGANFVKLAEKSFGVK
jgi:hypothetical protein